MKKTLMLAAVFAVVGGTSMAAPYGGGFSFRDHKVPSVHAKIAIIWNHLQERRAQVIAIGSDCECWFGRCDQGPGEGGGSGENSRSPASGRWLPASRWFGRPRRPEAPQVSRDVQIWKGRLRPPFLFSRRQPLTDPARAAAINSRVYSVLGASKISPASPASTTSPRFITMTLWLRARTTFRSWLMNR